MKVLLVIWFETQITFLSCICQYNKLGLFHSFWFSILLQRHMKHQLQTISSEANLKHVTICVYDINCRNLRKKVQLKNYVLSQYLIHSIKVINMIHVYYFKRYNAPKSKNTMIYCFHINIKYPPPPKHCTLRISKR